MYVYGTHLYCYIKVIIMPYDRIHTVAVCIVPLLYTSHWRAVCYSGSRYGRRKLNIGRYSYTCARMKDMLLLLVHNARNSFLLNFKFATAIPGIKNNMYLLDSVAHMAWSFGLCYVLPKCTFNVAI